MQWTLLLCLLLTITSTLSWRQTGETEDDYQPGAPPPYEEQIEGQPSGYTKPYGQLPPQAGGAYPTGAYPEGRVGYASSAYPQMPNYESAHTVHETHYSGPLDEIGNSFANAGFGVIMCVISLILLFWNEGRSLRAEVALTDAITATKEADSQKRDASLDGSLVHMTGVAESRSGALTDDTLRLNFGPVLGFNRTVTVLQWKEKEETQSRKEYGGGKTTTTSYSYEKTWSSTYLNSSNYKNKQIHPQNPSDWPCHSDTRYAPDVKFGAFTLNQDQISRIPTVTPFALPAHYEVPPEIARGRPVRVQGNEIYIGFYNDPRIGDMRITFTVAQNNTEISLLARQSGDTFAPYPSRASDYNVDLISVGRETARQMIDGALSSNDMLKWILRVVGFFLCWLGMSLSASPIEAIFNIIPFLGTLVGGLTTTLAFFLALSASLLTVAVAWIWYRPKVAIILLVLGIAIFFAGSKLSTSMGASATHTVRAAGGAASCFPQQKAFDDCLEASKNVAAACQYYLDQLQVCRGKK